MAQMRNAALAAAFFGLAAGPASAQTGAPATPAPATNLDAKPGTLSDKLSDTDGVIEPKGDVDPAMHKVAPKTGTMPVIKPGQVAPQSRDGTKDGKGGLY